MRSLPTGGELLISRESIRNLAHELRSPLTAIKSSVQLVVGGEAGPLTADQEHFLALALRNLDRLDRMTTDLLDRERGCSTTCGLAPRRVDLGKVLSEGVLLHEVVAEKAGLKVDATGLPSSFIAEIDPDRVMQIVDNLLGNALKFTSPPGQIHIWLDQQASPAPGLLKDLVTSYRLPVQTLTLVIQDSGRGIAADLQARLFEAFARVHDETRLDIPGSGLGLHITRDLVGAMGGTLSLASRPAEGTTVWVRLPRDEQSRQLILKVAGFEDRLAGRGSSAVRLQIYVLDLRGRSGMPNERDLADFVAHMEEQGIGLGHKVTDGLWVACMADPRRWDRAWSRFAFRVRVSAPDITWRKLGAPRVLKPRTVAELV